jgi:hypothetical protein
VQGLLHRGGTSYARLPVAGKEKWLSLETTSLEIAKAKLEAKKIGWEPKAGLVKADAAINAYRENLKLRVGIKESTRQFYQWSLGPSSEVGPSCPASTSGTSVYVGLSKRPRNRAFEFHRNIQSLLISTVEGHRGLLIWTKCFR